MSIRFYWIAFSIFGVVASFFSILVWPQPTYGTDFKGGTEVEVAFTKTIEAADLRSAVQKIGFAAPDIVSVTDPVNKNRFLVRVQETSNLDESQRNSIRTRPVYPAGKFTSARCRPR